MSSSSVEAEAKKKKQVVVDDVAGTRHDPRHASGCPLTPLAVA